MNIHVNAVKIHTETSASRSSHVFTNRVVMVLVSDTESALVAPGYMSVSFQSKFQRYTTRPAHPANPRLLKNTRSTFEPINCNAK